MEEQNELAFNESINMINNILIAINTVMETVLTKQPKHCISVSLPLELVRYLDSIRNPDIPRSRFLFRLVQRAIELEEEEKKQS